MEDVFMGYIRVLCHDVLNHLQVISGLAQLQKTDRLRAYVAEVGGQLKEVGRLARLGDTGLAAALFGLMQWLSRFGIPYRLTVEAEAARVLPGNLAAALVDTLILLGRELAALEGESQPVAIVVGTEGAAYLVRIILPGIEEGIVKAARACAASANAVLAGGRGDAQVVHGDGATVLTLTLQGAVDAIRPQVEE